MSAIVNPEPGDIAYVQYAAIDDYPIKAGVSVVKGNVYTLDADGYVIALTGASGAVNNLEGPLQAMAGTAAVSGESDGDRRVQCLGRRSRILMKAAANVKPAESVTIDVDGTTVTADKVEAGTSNVIGTVFETQNGAAKTADNDIVVVDLI